LIDEDHLVPELAKATRLKQIDRDLITHKAEAMVTAIRADGTLSMIDAFLQEYGLSTSEGVILMRLAESLIRTPDFNTAATLIRDKLDDGDWRAHAGKGAFLVKTGTSGLRLTRGWIEATGGPDAANLIARMGDQIVHKAIGQAMGILGQHFVLGHNIEAAAKRARNEVDYPATYSYDMLGEAALTHQDTERYFAAYTHALEHLAKTNTANGLHDAPGLSVKLSALHPRYEFNRREECVPALLEKLNTLAALAKSANLGLTIDAEETDRLEVSLLVFEALLANPDLTGWDGLGLAVQAYQRRALPTINWIYDALVRHDRKITLRLVKGAYWDSEIKRAQEMGLESYPVFTRKENTDVSYIACARRLLDCNDRIFPQFATHNAQSAAAILHMIDHTHQFEFQRLHGMSDALHAQLVKDRGMRSRTYAPVGKHRDLLPYLVRRLLENGANSSFVNQLLDENTHPADLAVDPIGKALEHDMCAHPSLGAPRDMFAGKRLAAKGIDLTQSDVAREIETLTSEPINAHGLTPNAEPENAKETVLSPVTGQPIGQINPSTLTDLNAAIDSAKASKWADTPVEERADVLRRAASSLADQMHDFMELCVTEAGKTWLDAEAEIREAVDFLRYYADEAEHQSLTPLGPVACISPWNFPLAIFLGQISAALAVGNTVIAKPAEQTPLVAFKAVKLLHESGVPDHALHLVLGAGDIGAALTGNSDIKAVCFTGSTETAKRIALSLADTGRPQTPLIAETGGINAMITDSTALLEQAVNDVVASAFQSAGQRCSACRLVLVQADIADSFIAMLTGAMATLKTGDPRQLETDLGPVIDAEAKAKIDAHIEDLKARHTLIAQSPETALSTGHFVRPTAFELPNIGALTEEIFGPVLHVVRYRSGTLNTMIEQINALGFGLTMGLHTRIDTRIEQVAAKAKVGNLYVNRNQIGAVVGVQPFGGQGLSGTGPKAGGPNYLKRLALPEEHIGFVDPLETVQLPGPTGEDNQLSYLPRGRLLCLGGDTPDILHQQIERVQATGNTPVFEEGADAEALLNLIDDQIDGVVADGTIREQTADRLNRRDGAILPLLSARDLAERFMVEKVVSIDTTAAGGNASLLAGL
jgi:RHH-type proline utilization regulon transcriptional repressor/proline dehydrogenase/delta 1-pyrroline-5-carboxylate dehydrogenase